MIYGGYAKVKYQFDIDETQGAVYIIKIYVRMCVLKAGVLGPERDDW